MSTPPSSASKREPGALEGVDPGGAGARAQRLAEAHPRVTLGPGASHVMTTTLEVQAG